MTENGKRKDAPTAGKDQQRAKKKKTGNAGKWKTPHQLAKMQLHQDANLQPGDTGIWVTCARHQEGKAAREIEVLFSEYAEKMYGIKSVHDPAPGGGGGEGKDDDGDALGGGGADDLEAAIRAEVAALTSKPSSAATGSSSSSSSKDPNRLTPLKMNVDCLLFVKTHAPIDPVAFVRRICEDARRCDEIPGLMRCRYVNRLTPVSVMGRATEAGLGEVAREVLGPWFDLKTGASAGGGGDGGAAEKGPEEGREGSGEGQAGVEAGEGNGDATTAAADAAPEEKKPSTFAIRPTIRNHSTLKRDVVINTIAGLINEDRHKVNLGSPDKVILVDIHQNVCGMSVVDGDWEDLKRYNLTELYGQGRKGAATSGTTGETEKA
ncbi:hypothetical protein VTJ83DRAFT_2995 [Remersonia thermophila]|uniref:THUMP domain-containing protein n=1 Tax=Remersonia thermophila TaxID=72144 RepID=A0ABR4DCS4_9PEZI